MPSSRLSSYSAEAESASRQKRVGLERSLPGQPSSELSVTFCYVYILRSFSTGNFYIGFTHDLRRRVTEHKKGLNRSTKAYASSWELVYYEAHRSEIDARRREQYLKTTAGNRALKKMMREQLLMYDLNNRKSTTRYA